jgi:hypothetical protein
MQTVISTGVLSISSNRATVRDEEADLVYECAYAVENGKLRLYHHKSWLFTEAEEDEFLEELHLLIEEQAADDADRALRFTQAAIDALLAVQKHWTTPEFERAMGRLDESHQILADIRHEMRVRRALTP